MDGQLIKSFRQHQQRSSRRKRSFHRRRWEERALLEYSVFMLVQHYATIKYCECCMTS